jgi:hypothetical protein
VNESLPFFVRWDFFEGFVSSRLGGAGVVEFLVLRTRLGLLVVFDAVVYALLCWALRVTRFDAGVVVGSLCEFWQCINW